jgi:hypothetical protein
MYQMPSIATTQKKNRRRRMRTGSTKRREKYASPNAVAQRIAH